MKIDNTEKKNVIQYTKPWHIFAATVFCSGIGGLFVLWPNLGAIDRRREDNRLILAFGTLSIMVIGLILFFDFRWYLTTLILLAVNVSIGAHFSHIYRRRLLEKYSKLDVTLPIHPDRRGTAIRIIIGWILSVFSGGLFGLLVVGIHDIWFSTLIPVSASIFHLIPSLVEKSVVFSLVGAALGGSLILRGKLKESKSVLKLGSYLMVTYFIFATIDILLLRIPSFQTFGIIGKLPLSFLTSMLICVASIIGIFACTLFLFSSSGFFQIAKRILVVLIVTLCFYITAVLYSGMLSFDLMMLGNIYERAIEAKKALGCYEKSLLIRSNDMISSYLQYRIGLLYHKLEEETQAQNAFKKVVAVYNKNEELVKKSQAFIRAYQRPEAQEGRRVVIPGVETKTEYKWGYCVPNTLSLVLRYWGVKETAKSIGTAITYFKRGTFVDDEIWYVHNKKMSHYLLAPSDLEQIKRFVSMDIPVLAYVPKHVFAVFGYDEKLNTLIAYDVAKWDIWVDYPIEEFREEWKKENNQLGLILPPQKESLFSKEEITKFKSSTNACLRYYMARRIQEEEVQFSHLRKAMVVDPELFFLVTYFYQHFPRAREEVVSYYLNRPDFVSKLDGYIEKSFGGPFFTSDYSSFKMGLNQYESLKEILASKSKTDELPDYVLFDLALLYFKEKNYEAASAILLHLNELYRRSLILPISFLEKGHVHAAIDAYAEIIQGGSIWPGLTEFSEMPFPPFPPMIFSEEIMKRLASRQITFLDVYIAANSLIELCIERQDYGRIVKEIKTFLQKYPLHPRAQYYYAFSLWKEKHKWLDDEPKRRKNIKAIRDAIGYVENIGFDLGVLEDPKITKKSLEDIISHLPLERLD